MNRFVFRSTASVLLLCVVTVMAGCLSQVGDESGSGPTAVMASAGYAVGTPGNGSISVNVRAQSQVVLTGRESVAGSTPILGFLIQPTNAAATAAPLTVLDNSSVKVNLPAVYGATPDLTYRLTVTDANGRTATANATLHVVPALDSNRFIQPGVAANPMPLPRFRVVAGTKDVMALNTAFSLTVKSRVTYRTLDGLSNTVDFDLAGNGLTTAGASGCTATAAPQALSGIFIPGSGGPQAPLLFNATYADSFLAAKYDFALPTIEPDAIIRLFQAGLPATAACLPDPGWMYADNGSDVTGVQVVVSLSIPTQPSEGVLYVLDASDRVVASAVNAGDGTPTTLTLSAGAIDPNLAQVTAGVQPLRLTGGGSESKATAQAYYEAIDPTSSKTSLSAWLRANCMDASLPTYGADLHSVYTNNFDLGFGRDMYVRTTPCANGLVAGDVAAVVINYATVEAAAKKTNPILAVAMEYRAPAVPTQPAAARIVSFYAFAPDQGTGDYRRVLAVDFDGRGEKFVPGSCNVCHGGTPRTVAAYSAGGANIGAHFMPWDLESFLYSDSPTAPAIQGNDAPNAALRARYTRAAQEPVFKAMNLAVAGTYGTLSSLAAGGYNFTCASAEFAGPCSLLQLWYGNTLASQTFIDQQVPASWAPAATGNASSGRLYLDVFARNCRACHIQQGGTTSAVPTFVAYSDLAAQAANVKRYVFQEGDMPGSRLTTDRLWGLGAPPGTLATELATDLGLTGVTAPGAPIAQLCSALPSTVVAGTPVPLSGGCSDFATGYQWSLTTPAGSSARLANPTGALASFRPDVPGTYTAQLTVTGVDGTQSTVASSTAVSSPVAQPLTAQVSLNTAIAKNVLASAVPAGGAGDTVTVDSISAGSGITASVDAAQTILITATTFTGGVIGYSIHDAAGNVSSSTITVTVSASLAANNLAATVASNAGPGALMINLSAQVQGDQGQGVTFTLVDPAPLAGRATPLTHQLTATNCTAATAVTPCTIGYQPPGGVSSVYGAVVVGASDTFGFTACLTQKPATCTSGTVTVQIQGLHPFAAVAAIANSTCASCHTLDQTALGSSWQMAATPASEQNIYCAIRFTTGIAPVASDAGVPLVNPANPSASLLYRKPQGLDSHGGANNGLSAGQLQAILDWISEGGYLSSSSDQSCPP